MAAYTEKQIEAMKAKIAEHERKKADAQAQEDATYIAPLADVIHTAEFTVLQAKLIDIRNAYADDHLINPHINAILFGMRGLSQELARRSSQP